MIDKRKSNKFANTPLTVSTRILKSEPIKSPISAPSHQKQVSRSSRSLSSPGPPPIHKGLSQSVVSSSRRSQTFKLIGDYPYVKSELESKGWLDKSSSLISTVDFCYATPVKCIDHKTLSVHQIVNHFKGITHYTIKSNLCETLSDLVWQGVDIRLFSPLTFCLHQWLDDENFVDTFEYYEVI